MVPDPVTAADVVKTCGDFSQAVDLTVGVWRNLWALEHGPPLPAEAPKDAGPFVAQRLDTALGMLVGVPDQFAHAFKMRVLGDSGGSFRAHLAVNDYDLMHLAAKVLGPLRPAPDLRYFVMRSLRRHSGCDLGPEVAIRFQALAEALNALLSGDADKLQALLEPGEYGFALSALATEGKQPKTRFRLNEVVRTILRHVQGTAPAGDQRLLDLFVECCHAVGYLRHCHEENGKVQFRTASVDGEYLFSKLFGMPTEMAGFDDLFGGGGVRFVEHAARPGSVQFPARTMLIKGRFGTGKSLLGLSLAVEVARKEGVALYFALEQNFLECEYTLAAMKLGPRDGTFVVTQVTPKALTGLQQRTRGKGLLILVNLKKDEYKSFLDTLSTRYTNIQGDYALRLLCVDPLNSLLVASQKDVKEEVLRRQTLEAFQTIKDSGTNLVLLCEEDVGGALTLDFEENLADTVVHLSVDSSRHGYAQRYFEVLKSRLQREQRGRHPFSIQPGKGIRIFPAPAAVRARNWERSVHRTQKGGPFGLDSLDRLLGTEKVVQSGSLLVLKGPIGSFKTHLGLAFLLGIDRPTTSRQGEPEAADPPSTLMSLFVTMHYDEVKVSVLRRRPLFKRTRVNNLNKRVRTVALRGGFINPGVVFRTLEEEFARAAAKGLVIDRVLLHEVTALDHSCPFIRDDNTFADTLIEFLRRRQVATLASFAETSSDTESPIRQSLLQSADTLIELERLEYHGRQRILLSIQLTPGMTHRREQFELTGDDTRGLEVSGTPTLLRRAGDGGAQPVGIRLFLHAESEIQRAYNRQVCATVRALLSEDTKLEPQRNIPFTQSVVLSRLSAVDEVQLFQLDEFQLGLAYLYEFPEAAWKERVGEWDSSSPRFAKTGSLRRKSFRAVPYYNNLSLLAFRDSVRPEDVRTWQSLAQRCQERERSLNADEVFFDFPRASPENYNVLFLEILSSLQPLWQERGRCNLLRWLEGDKPVEAALLFWRLCRRAYLLQIRSVTHARQQHARIPRPRVDPRAHVWRHWFSTLREMMTHVPPEQYESIRVTSLPGGVSTAGEWYLAVPAYSAAPEVGLELIRLLTSRDAELDRTRRGVGLPTRRVACDPRSKFDDADAVLPYTDLNQDFYARLERNLLRRSDFGCYARLASLLAYHLRQILELGGQSGESDMVSVEASIRQVFRNLHREIGHSFAHLECDSCRGPRA
jgi:KaiC/GvpD/RAD55 family RecA-like ATPase